MNLPRDEHDAGTAAPPALRRPTSGQAPAPTGAISPADAEALSDAAVPPNALATPDAAPGAWAGLPRGRRAISIRMLVALVVVLPVAAVAVALVLLSSATSLEIAEDLAATLAESATDRVQADLRSFLAEATQLSDRYARRISEQRLTSAGALADWDQPMFEDLVSAPSVASICFGNPAGDATWLLRGHFAPLELGHVDGSRGGEAREFAVNPQTGAVARYTPLRVYQYDPRKRPWWDTAIDHEAQGPHWTPIYFWFGETGRDSTTGTGYTRVVRDPSGRMMGVLVVDVTLGDLSETLKTLPIASRGFAFVVDERGLLVAASRGAVNSPTGGRIRLDQSDDPVARAAARLQLVGGDAASAQFQRFNVDGQPVRATVNALSPYPGINWRVIVGAPESAFLADALELRRRQVIMAVIAAVGSTLLALVLGRQLTRPLLRLTEHVRRVGQGDLGARLELDATRELEQLSHELNRMTEGLRQRMQLERSLDLAREMQQSLLPAEVPRVPGLEVAARCRYCDSTGGDYYDFLDICAGTGRCALIAIGDALGHGIASALLMATARAALRTSAALSPPPSLGQMMSHVNGVLAHGAGEGRFMTMLLVCIDGPARTLRWARAGHEPFILYDPDKDVFLQLQGGGIPLGIEPIDYDEHRQATLPPGMILVAGTDGLWEATNAAGEMFGRERLRDTLRAAAAGNTASAADIVDAVDRALTDFLAGAAIKDDVTLVVIRLVAVDQPLQPTPAAPERVAI